MNTYTGMAIDAYRRAEQARRRLERAEAEAAKARRLVPRSEEHLWFLHTELIRMEADRDAAEAARDQDAAAAACRLIGRLQEDIRGAVELAAGEKVPS